MRDVSAHNRDLQIVIHDDDETPWEFVVELLRSVLGHSEANAAALAATAAQQGIAACGIYPAAVASAMLDTAQQRIKAAGHPLLITVGPPAPEHHDKPRGKFKYAHEALAWHFAGLGHDEIVTTSRQFPGHMRADVQVALDKLLSASPIRFFGLYEQHRYETLNYAALTKEGQNAVTISAAQFQDVDIGEEQPVKCLKNGLWLNRDGDSRYAASPSTVSTDMRLESASRSRFWPARKASPSCSAVSASWRPRSMPPDPIAARRSRSMPTATIAAARKA